MRFNVNALLPELICGVHFVDHFVSSYLYNKTHDNRSTVFPTIAGSILVTK